MIAFFVGVDSVFFDNDRHPIAIPQEADAKMAQEGLVDAGGQKTDVNIIFANGRRVEGQIDQGGDASGSIRQLAAKEGYPKEYLGHLLNSDVLCIVVEKRDEEIQVRFFDELEGRIKGILSGR
jgi:hypothetical protein